MHDPMIPINKPSIGGELTSFVKDHLSFVNFRIRCFLYEPLPHPELFISLRNDILKEYSYISLLFQ